MDASTLPPLPTTPPPEVSDPNSLAPLPPDRSNSPASSSSSSSSSSPTSTEESQVLQMVAQEVLQSPKKNPRDIKDDQIIARLKAGEGGSVQLSADEVALVLDRLTISGPTSPPPMIMPGEILGTKSIMITPFEPHKPEWHDMYESVSAKLGEANNSFTSAIQRADKLQDNLKIWTPERKIENYREVVNDFKKGRAIFEDSLPDLLQLRGSLEHLKAYYYNRPIATQDVHAAAKGLQVSPEEIISSTKCLSQQRATCKEALKTLDGELGRMLMGYDSVQTSILGLTQTVTGKEFKEGIVQVLSGFLASPSVDRLVATLKNITSKMETAQTSIQLKVQGVQKGKEKDSETMSEFFAVRDVALYRIRQASWLTVVAEFYKDRLTEKKAKKEENPVSAGQEIAVGSRLHKEKCEIDAEMKFRADSIAKKETRIDELDSHVAALNKARSQYLEQVNAFRQKVEYKPKTLTASDKAMGWATWSRKQDYAVEVIAPEKLVEVKGKLQEACLSHRQTLDKYKVSATKPDLSSQLVGPDYDVIVGDWFKAIDLEASKKSQT